MVQGSKIKGNAKLDNQWFVTAADVTRDGAYDAYYAIALDLFLNGYMELAQKNGSLTK